MSSDERYGDDLPAAELERFLDEARRGDWNRAAWRALGAPSQAWDVAHHGGRHDWIELVDLVPGGEILDLGSAYGGLALALARKGCVVTALDVKASRLALLSSRLDGEMEPHPRPVRGDVLALPFRDGVFHGMTCFGVLEWLAVNWRLEDPVVEVQRDGLVEMRRCLRPDGRLWLSWENPEGARYRAGAAEDHTGLPGLMTAPPDEAERLCRHYTNRSFRAHCLDLDASRALFAEAGFHPGRCWIPFPHYKAPRAFLPMRVEALSEIRALAAEWRWDPDLSAADRAAAAGLAEAEDLDALRRAAGAFLHELEVAR